MGFRVRSKRERKVVREPIKLGADHTLTLDIAIDVIGSELLHDRYGTIEEAAAHAAELVRQQLEYVEAVS